MAAGIAKNEVTASKRRAVLEVVKLSDNSFCPRGTSLAAYLYVGASVASIALATGTLSNVRRALTFTSFTFTASSATDQLTKVAHALETGDGPINVSNSGGALPAPLAAATPYYVIKVDADNIKLATSVANAYAGTAIDLTTNGTGTQTLAAATGCERGMDGFFLYEFTQAETNVDGSELGVWIVPESTYQAFTSIAFNNGVADIWNYVLENGRTAGDLMRLTVRSLVARFTKTGNDYVIRDLANSKDSHSSTVTASGKTASSVIDPT